MLGNLKIANLLFISNLLFYCLKTKENNRTIMSNTNKTIYIGHLRLNIKAIFQVVRFFSILTRIGP